MSEYAGETDGQAAPAGKRALVAGEFRYLATTGLVVRVVAPAEDATLVEHVPSGLRVLVHANRELEQATLAHPEGFRVRWACGELSLEPSADAGTLRAILLDEEQNGRDRIRLRVLDEYLGPVPDAAGLAERLRLALTGTDAWMRVGRGSDLGYMPADRQFDWRARWKREELPVPSDRSIREDEALVVLRDGLQQRAPNELGKVVACAWLPAPLRAEAVDLLVELWRAGGERTAFHGVVDDAMTKVTERLRRDGFDDREWRELLTSTALSSSVRSAMVKAWKQERGGVSSAALLAGAPPVENLGVMVDLLVLTDERSERVEVLSRLFDLAPPEDIDEHKDARRRVGAWFSGLGADALPVVIAAVRGAIARRVPGPRVEAWTHLVGPTTEAPSFGEVLRALATVERLEGTRGDLDPFGLARATVEAGLTRWVQREIEPDLPLDIDVVDEARRTDGHLRLPRMIDLAVASRDHARLGTWVTALSVEVARCGAEAERLRNRVEDPANAQRVLGRAVAELTVEERAELKRSALAEVETIRRKDREQMARMISEGVTAVERLAASGAAPQLANLSRRLRELATDLALVVEGSVGDRVLIDPALHETTGAVGTPGEVRRVGVVGADGLRLVKPAVIPFREGA